MVIGVMHLVGKSFVDKVLTSIWLANAIVGTSTMHPVPVEMETEVVHINEENTPDSENEEGWTLIY